MKIAIAKQKPYAILVPNFLLSIFGMILAIPNSMPYARDVPENENGKRWKLKIKYIYINESIKISRFLKLKNRVKLNLNIYEEIKLWEMKVI